MFWKGWRQDFLGYLQVYVAILVIISNILVNKRQNKIITIRWSKI